MTISENFVDEKQQRLIRSLERGLGKEVVAALRDETVEDIVLNESSKVWVKRSGDYFRTLDVMLPDSAYEVLHSLASIRNTVINHDHPIIETELPIGGCRFEGLIPPVVEYPVFAIRARAHRVYTLEDYASAGILTSAEDPRNQERVDQKSFAEMCHGLNHAAVLRRAIEWRKNILVVGATGSGKTTLVNALLHEISTVAPDDRVITIEDTYELQCPSENKVSLHAHGSVSMLALLRVSMRLAPTRIVVGEVRGPEALTLLKSWNTGHPGGICTVHANDALSGLDRLEQLVAEATAAPQQRLIGEAVDLIVFIDQATVGRKVREVLLVLGFADGKYECELV